MTLILGTLACCRLTRLLVSDKIFTWWRAWIVRRFGPESLAAYWAHCPWCTGMWVCAIIMPPAVIYPNVITTAILAPFAAAYVVGYLAAREEE